jgi:hypothetical protein
MTTTDTAAPPAYIGWWRCNRKARWSCVAGGADYDAAWQATLDVLDQQRVHGGESLVLSAGRHPNETAARRPR